MQKPSVLPDPVWPRPRMSRPAMASGSVAAWMGNGVVIPAAARAATSGAGTPAAAKEVACGTAEVTVRGAADPAWRRLPRGADWRSAGRTDKKYLLDRVAAFSQAPHPWKPARISSVRPARRVRLRVSVIGRAGLPST